MFHVFHDLFSDRRRDALLHREKALYGTVLPVICLIKPGHIDTREPGGPAQEFHPAKLLFPALFVQSHQLPVPGLPFSQVKHVKEIRQGLRIIGTGAASNDNGTVLPSLQGIQGNLGQVQNLQDIGIAHFILYGYAQKIKILHRILGFQGKEGNV